VNDQDEERRPVDRWAEALAWYGTMRAADEQKLTSTVGRAWQDWYADAENRRVFDDVSRLMAERNVYRNRPRPSDDELEQDRYDASVPIAEWLSADPPRETRRWPSHAAKRRRISGGLTMAAILLLVVVLSPYWFRSNRGYVGPTVYQTDVGGLKEIHLPDGSSITLGGQTRLLVAFSAQRRSVSLFEGQAWLKVSHNPGWPFLVVAGGGTIKDVGTAFLVTRESDRVVVTVTEGIVEVATRTPLSVSSGAHETLTSRPVMGPVRVSRGEELAFSDNGTLSVVKSADARAATAWTHGRLTFDDQPLRYVVETVDRYSSRPIVVSRAAGRLRFSGIVSDKDITDWLQSLEVILPVTIKQRRSGVQIDIRSAATAPR
jgi:transmembrane sensor